MKNLNRIFLGGVLGFVAPLTLAICNETLFVAKQVNEGIKIWDTFQICAFERRWFPLYPKVNHAPGCKNNILDSIPLCLLVGVLGGSLMSALTLLKEEGQKV